MGNSSSMPRPPGQNHSAIPQDVVPYSGALVEYRTLLVNSKLKVHFTGGTSSDVNEYMATLAAQYAEYFKLDTFFRVPFSLKSAGFTTVMVSFQAIFSRPAVYVPSPEVWQLQVVPTRLKLSLNMGALFGAAGVDTGMTDIYANLQEKANVGGRLICLECNGDSHGGFTSAKFGINMFFSIPSHPNPALYKYVAFCTPMKIRQGMRSIDIDMDILGTLALHLDQGWKLIDIIIPQYETQAGAVGKRRFPSAMNTIWFFEKELSRCNANDNTPLHQVTVIDVYVTVRVGFGGVSDVDCDLGPLLVEMGQRGWSLVCVLDTPKINSSGMKINVLVKAFFQRLVPQVVPFPGAHPADAPPPYTPLPVLQ